MTTLTDALWMRYRGDRDEETRRLLLDQYVGLVHFAAREMIRRLPPALDIEDLVCAGTVGLVQALESFESSRGLAFSTFALPRIRGAMLDELRSWDWVPRTVRDRGRKIERARVTLEQRLGRTPQPEEIAEYLRIDATTCRAWVEEAQGPVLLTFDSHHISTSMNEPHFVTGIPDPNASAPDDAIIDEESVDALQEAIASLSARERAILSLYYYEKLTLRQIGEVLHITESRVSQIHSRTIHRLRERIESVEKAA